MTEYIERGALLEGLKFPTREEIEKRYIEIEADQQPLDVLVDTMLAISRVYLEKVEGAPAADVEPVVRAKWEREFKEVPVKDGSRCVMKVLYKCAGEYGCKEYSIINSKRCPNCGAHMGERSDA